MSGSSKVSSGPSQSSGSSGSSGSTTGCPDPSWSATVYNAPSGNFQVHSPTLIEFRVEASEDCGGSNPSSQACDAGFVVNIPTGYQMVIEWTLDLVTETQDPDKDYVEIGVDAVVSHYLASTDFDGGCATTSKSLSASTTIVGDGNDHTFFVYFDNYDPLYHTTSVGFNFEITACAIEPV